MHKIAILTLFTGFLMMLGKECHGQSNAPWVTQPTHLWPPIAMINEVWYTTGERYVHPSFEYVATGFLIDIGTDTIAATVKHSLWVAKTKSMQAVDFNGQLQRWIMHPKRNLQDSVVIDQIINRDPEELLSGPQSSITERDWLLFTTSHVSQRIQPLKPRYTPIKKKELIWFTGCPYQDSVCVTYQSVILDVQGDRILFSTPPGLHLGGARGSPIIDAQGYLIGILGGSTVVKYTGTGALYGISTQYLKKVLTYVEPLNVALLPSHHKMEADILKCGLRKSIHRYKKLSSQNKNHFKYSFSFEALNVLAASLVKEHKLSDALAIYKLSANEYPVPQTLMHVATSYRSLHRDNKAIKLYTKVLKMQPDHQEAIKALNEFSFR